MVRNRLLRRELRLVVPAVLVGAAGLAASVPSVEAVPSVWRQCWPKTDFTRHSVDLSESSSGGPGKDGIPAIDRPRFVSTGAMARKKWLSDTEPVISLVIGGNQRAYPLRILIWHEIVNDTVGGLPVAVTYCPLCNSAIAFDRRVDGRVLDFGTTGNLRRSDLVMYDRQTESWWQQFTGEAIVGTMTGTLLKVLPARVESFALFRDRASNGKVLVPNDDVHRPYGVNPYRGYDSSDRPFLFSGELPSGTAPLAYVLAVGDEAWSLDLLRRVRRVETADPVITWTPSQNSALDRGSTDQGRDIGNVVVRRKTAFGSVGAVYNLTFAFVFYAFRPGGVLRK